MSDRSLDIVLLAQPAWDGPYAKSTVQLARALARRHRVLYVEYPFTVKDLALGWSKQSETPVRRMLGVLDRLRHIDGVHVLTLPPVLPANALPAGRVHAGALRLNATIAAPVIRHAMRTCGIERPVVVCAFNPFLGLPLAGRLGERARVYYGYDDIGAAPWAKRHGERLERAYIAQADAVIASSKALTERFAVMHERVRLVRNGVDFQHFNVYANAWPRERTAGYVGSLDSRIDYELLEAVIARLPEVEFRFTGRIVSERAQALAAFPNVVLRGPRPMRTLPAEMSRICVGLIPFVCDRFTRGIYPLKVNEYLAAGRPVIATPFAPMRDVEEVVHTAPTSDDMARMIDELTRQKPANASALTAAARANDWAQRAEAFSAVLEEATLNVPEEATR